MISVLNRYLHGYVFLPFYDAFLSAGILHGLLEKPSAFDEIRSQYGLNPGCLKLGLGMLESLSWVTLGVENKYTLSDNFIFIDEFHERFACLYEVPVETFVSSSSQKGFVEFAKDFDCSSSLAFLNETNICDDRLLAFLESAVIIPFLYVLTKSHGPIENISLQNFPANVQANIEEVFLALDMGVRDGDKVLFNEKGKYLVDNMQKAGTVLSYRPLFSRLHELLVHPNANLLNQFKGAEGYVDREMNVIGSGDQHGIFFDDFRKHLHSFISNLEDPSVVKAVVDVGCGDGSLLRGVYASLQKACDPLMVGVDSSLEALGVTGKTLHGIPHILLQGDIEKPDDLLEDLSTNHSLRKDQILHIRSFLDHDRNYKEPKNTEDLRKRKRLPYNGVYFDSTGKELPPYKVVQNLVEYLGSWSDIVGELGLFILEVFSQDPEITKRYLDEIESFHFDVYHSLSQQLLVAAEIYLMSAAEVGLFTHSGRMKKYPGVLPFTRVMIAHFFKRPYTARHPDVDDIDRLHELEEAVAPEFMLTSKEELSRRISSNPRGQYVLKLDGQIVGSAYTRRINKVDQMYKVEDQVSHMDNGAVVQLLGFNLDLNHQGSGLSYEFLHFVLLHNFLKSGVKTIAGVSRCGSFHSAKDISLEEYVSECSAKRRVDPILAFHQALGGTIDGTVPGFRPFDSNNSGNGVSVEYKYRRLQSLGFPYKRK